MSYYISKEVPVSFSEAIDRATDALQKEGFGVLTEIDVQATLKKKLDVDREPFLILGACHPPSAHKATTAVPAVGVYLPCNVTVSVEDGETVVRAMNPGSVAQMLTHPAIEEMAVEVGGALRRVVESTEVVAV